MAIFPIHTATDGLIRTTVPAIDTLVIGTRGLLWQFDIVPPTGPDPEPPITPGGGGKSKGGKAKGRTYKVYKDNKKKDLKFDFIKREDEEIMVVIKTFIKCQ